METSKSIEQISECFQNLSEEDLAILNEQKTQVSFFKGETIFKQGAFASHILFVNSGLALVYLQLGKEKQVNIRIARQGDFMSFSTIFDKNTYQYSAIALADSTICMIEKETIKSILIRNPDFAMRIVSKNSSNSNRYLEIIKNVSYKQMRGKLASAILYLASDKFKNDSIFQHLTRQDIANFASITVESTVKFLKEFEQDGLISLDGKEIIIKDGQRLRDLDLRG